MSVILEGSIKRWIGLSTDTKPAPGQTRFDPVLNTSTPLVALDVPAGSSFLETDTGRIYRWDGEQWAHSPAEEDAQVAVLQAVLNELTQLRQMVALVIGA